MRGSGEKTPALSASPRPQFSLQTQTLHWKARPKYLSRQPLVRLIGHRRCNLASPALSTCSCSSGSTIRISSPVGVAVDGHFPFQEREARPPGRPRLQPRRLLLTLRIGRPPPGHEKVPQLRRRSRGEAGRPRGDTDSLRSSAPKPQTKNHRSWQPLSLLPAAPGAAPHTRHRAQVQSRESVVPCHPKGQAMPRR